MGDIAIRVQGLGKQYHLGMTAQQYSRLSDQLVDGLLAPFKRARNLIQGRTKSAADVGEAFWALRNASFEVRQGDVVGIIGRNGAGKSTLLKILSRITEPTTGCVDLYGRAGSLLEVGTGFHPELTGRENIYLNGAIQGMNKREIDRKLPQIVEFAEIGQYLDTPVKHYSSGMYVRLAFSISAHLEPEILMVDEVLAVGDVEFQRKCLGKMDDVSKEGRTVLFVSHNMGLMQTLCKRGIFLQQGQISVDGSIGEAIDSYLRTLEQVRSQDLATRTDRKGRGAVKLVGVEITNGVHGGLRTGEPARFIFHLSSHIAGLYCNFTVFNHVGQPVTIFKSRTPGPDDVRLPGKDAITTCVVDDLLLLPGRYRIDVWIIGDNQVQDHVEAAAVFDVAEGAVAGRPVIAEKRFSVMMPHRWILPK